MSTPEHSFQKGTKNTAVWIAIGIMMVTALGVVVINNTHKQPTKEDADLLNPMIATSL